MRLRAYLIAVLLLTCPIMARAAAPSDLNASFMAAFGHKPPLIRQTFMPTFLDELISGESEPWAITVKLTPDRLVPLGASRWALIVNETIQDVGQAYPGAIAVAYLHRSDQHWQKEGVWPEVFYSGWFGMPANDAAAVKYFGAAPLFLATSEWCGQGTCNETIQLMRLDPLGPHYLGTMLGGAWFPWAAADLAFDDFDCETYGYSAKVEPPTRRDAILSIVYQGWRAPPGKLNPKTRFRYKTNFVLKHGKLAMQPTVPIPSCAR